VGTPALSPQTPQTPPSFSTFYFDAPRTPGTYIVKYFPSLCGYTDIFRSLPIVIPKRDVLMVESIFTQEIPNRIKTFKLRWNIFSLLPSESDYVGLYELEAPNNFYMEYKYIDSSSGCIYFTAPTGIGKYQFRYHSASQSKYQDVIRSDPVEIKDTDIIEASLDGKNCVKVTWDIISQPKSSWDWIGIFECGATNKNYVYSTYITNTQNDIIWVPITTLKTGFYEARYFSDKLGKYATFKISKPFEFI